MWQQTIMSEHLMWQQFIILTMLLHSPKIGDTLK